MSLQIKQNVHPTSKFYLNGHSCVRNFVNINIIIIMITIIITIVLLCFTIFLLCFVVVVAFVIAFLIVIN